MGPQGLPGWTDPVCKHRWQGEEPAPDGQLCLPCLTQNLMLVLGLSWLGELEDTGTLALQP